MGKKIREKLAHQAALDQRLSDRLTQTKTFVCDRAPAADLNEILEPFADRFVQSPQTFSRKMKTNDDSKRLLALARHVFGRYKIARIWDQVWSVSPQRTAAPVNRFGPAAAAPRLLTNSSAQFRSWAVCLATGGSLYKEHTKSFLSKKETHLLATCPHSSLTIKQAIVFAIAKATGSSDGAALRLAQSNLANKELIQDGFWRDVVRFFAHPQTHPENVSQINDLLDYLNHRHAENVNYSIFGMGYSLASLRRKMIEWHHELRREKQLGDYAWSGFDLPDWFFDNKVLNHQTGRKEKTEWSLRQIKTSKELGREGQAMRHCVVSYRPLCQKGTCSIWSLSSMSLGVSRRHVTVELSAGGQIVQVRGFANRAAHPEEMDVVKRWAQQYNLSLGRYI